MSRTGIEWIRKLYHSGHPFIFQLDAAENVLIFFLYSLQCRYLYTIFINQKTQSGVTYKKHLITRVRLYEGKRVPHMKTGIYERWDKTCRGENMEKVLYYITIYIVIYLIQYNKRGLNIPRCLLRSMGNNVKIYVVSWRRM